MRPHERRRPRLRRAPLDKLRADGAAEARSPPSTHYARRLAGGDRGCCPSRDRAGRRRCPTPRRCPSPERPRATLLDRDRRHQAQRRPGHEHGHDAGQVAAEVKDGLTFLDVIARQVLDLRGSAPAPRLPLVLMNSFATREDSLAALARYAALSADLPPDFLQNKVPKLLDDDSLRPAGWPANPELEWAPPGHGDLYTALRLVRRCSTALLERGYRYAFVSNADNLGAVLDPRDPRLVRRASGAPFADGGRRPHRGRPQGRAPRAARAAAGSCCARSRRPPTRTSTPSRTSRATATSTRTRLGRPARRCADAHRRGARRARAADDRQPQDGRPGRRRLARR